MAGGLALVNINLLGNFHFETNPLEENESKLVVLMETQIDK